jgi:phage tail sheath gpL-like
VTQSGQVQPQKVITTYQLNAAGVADNSYLNVERLYTLMQVLRLRTAFLWSQFGRKALVSNSTQIPQGSNRVNAATIQGSVVAYQYYLQDTRGLVQNAATFAGNVQVNNMGNGLVTVLAPDDLTNQLDIIAILVQFVAS